MVSVTLFFSRKEEVRDHELLKNNITIKAHVLNVQKSNNHDFGIILLKVDSSNAVEFNKSLHQEMYPYRIRGGEAELYTTIPDGIKKGDIVMINSNQQVVWYFYLQSGQKFDGALQIVTDGFNMDYIRANTAFK